MVEEMQCGRANLMEGLINGIAGRKVENLYPKLSMEPGNVLLEVKNLGRDGVFEDVSFQVRAGEISWFCRAGRCRKDGNYARNIRHCAGKPG